MSVSFFMSSVLLFPFLKCEEFCNTETFRPACGNNGILLIEEAIYGRKNLKRCLLDEEEPNDANRKDSRFFGCHSNVKKIIEPQCSGRNKCKIPVVSIMAKTDCYKYLKQHLEISYRCVSG